MTLTYWIIGITAIVSWYSFDKPEILKKLLLNPYSVNKNREYYRFITSGFVHANFPHLLWNMFSFYFFGSVVEYYFNYLFGSAGPLLFIILYLLAIIVSDMPSYFNHKDNPRYNSLGASGGVAAIIFASILFQPLQDICLYGILCFPGFIFGVAYLVGSYYYGKRGKDNINHAAHIYGALVGLVFCAIIYPRS
ncbi:MAG: rhomboid family intramembrane serine protease, partial [Candidatus Kapaibacterium sp.]